MQERERTTVRASFVDPGSGRESGFESRLPVSLTLDERLRLARERGGGPAHELPPRDFTFGAFDLAGPRSIPAVGRGGTQRGATAGGTAAAAPAPAPAAPAPAAPAAPAARSGAGGAGAEGARSSPDDFAAGSLPFPLLARGGSGDLCGCIGGSALDGFGGGGSGVSAFGPPPPEQFRPETPGQAAACFFSDAPLARGDHGSVALGIGRGLGGDGFGDGSAAYLSGVTTRATMTRARAGGAASQSGGGCAASPEPGLVDGRLTATEFVAAWKAERDIYTPQQPATAVSSPARVHHRPTGCLTAGSFGGGGGGSGVAVGHGYGGRVSTAPSFASSRSRGGGGVSVAEGPLAKAQAAKAERDAVRRDRRRAERAAERASTTRREAPSAAPASKAEALAT